eukprot:gene14222-15726_t
MSRRSTALANETSHKFIDPISLDLMKDPVVALDGHSYDRQTITKWFDAQRAQGRPITSPRTNLPLADDTLTPNIALKRELDVFIASISSTIQPDDIRFTLSSEIFKDLDQLSSIPGMCLLDFEPPKIVVLGNESHGKSTILERMIGLPLFPKEKGVCTRCVVRVHMRRCAADQPSLAEISVQKTPATRTTQPPPPPLPHLTSEIVALDNIREKIKEVMDDLVRNDPQRRMIIDDHEIIVKINLPYCLNVDILDLPGLVTTSPASTTQNLPQVTKEIAMRVIGEQRESSFFLLVNDVRVPANQSRGCEVVQEAKIEGQTLGIFTKVDTFVSEDGSESAELQQLLDSSRGGFPLGYGWMAAASRSVDMGGTTNKLQAFQLMEQNESRCFREKYETLVAMNKMGIQQIRQRIQTLYEFFIHESWIPHIRTKLNEYISNFEDQMVELGVPLPRDNDYLDLTTFLIRVMKVNWLITFDEEWIRTFTAEVLPIVLDSIEKDQIKRINDETFWNSLERYYKFIEPEKITISFTHLRHEKVSEQNPYAEPYERWREVKNYKYGSESFERDIPALEMIEARKVLELKVRECLTQMWEHLHDRIDPAKLLAKIHTLLGKKATEVDPKFKLERFDALHAPLVRVVTHCLSIVVKSFDTWFQEFISRINEKPLLKPVHYLSSEVRCILYWSNRDELHSYPDVILENFYRCVKENWPERLGYVLKLDDLKGLEEKCKATRLNYFEDVKKVNEVKEAVEAFAQKVQKEKLKQEGKEKRGGGGGGGDGKFKQKIKDA